MNLDDILSKASFRDNYWVIIIPAALIVLDILTGVIHAWATGHLKSYKMREGLNHKSGELCVLLMGELFTYGMQLPQMFIQVVSGYVIFMELISIIENLDKMGVPMPKFIKIALRNAKDKIDNGGNPDISGKEDTKNDDGGNSG